MLGGWAKFGTFMTFFINFLVIQLERFDVWIFSFFEFPEI
jgi:hypothetical protein